MSYAQHAKLNSKRIGLTGNIGSGKSTVADLLIKKGAALIDSDALARAATNDADVLTAIQTQLGKELVQDGALDRQKTAELVFNNPEALKTLNSIIHPWVRAESVRRTQALLEQEKPPAIIIFDIPLLYENALETTVDAVIVVDVPLELRIHRVQERSGLSEDDIRVRDAAQLELTEKVKRADYVIDNSKGLDELKQQVNEVWSKLIDLV